MKTSSDQVAMAVGGYYEGRSLSAMPKLMYQLSGNYINKASVYRWIDRLTKLAVAEAAKTKIEVGDVWIIKGKVVVIGGKRCWVIDIIDSTTKFLLATKLSRGRSVEDIRQTLEIARQKAGKVPKIIITEGFKGYEEGIEIAYGSEIVSHIRITSFNNQENFKEISDEYNESLQDHIRILHPLKRIDHAYLISDGWLVHYNYFRLHRALNNRTPADEARANFKFHTWSDLISQNKSESNVVKIKGLQILVNIPKIREPGLFGSLKDTNKSNIANIPLLVSRSSESNEVMLSRHKPKRNNAIKILGKL
jgi:putative transposase